MIATHQANALAHSSEAAVPVLTSSSATTLPAGPTWTFSQSWRTRLTAAGRVLHALRGRAKKCRDAMPPLSELIGWASDEGAHEQCGECGRPCAKVLPDLPTAEPCRGPLAVGQCVECVGVVELSNHPRYHVITNERRIDAKDFYARGKPAAGG